MKATVMESKAGTSVILTEDGIFRSVKGEYEVGEVIEYNASVFVTGKTAYRIAAIAASLLIILSAGLYSYRNTAVYAAVTVDGENSVTLELNRRNNVIGIKADGENSEEVVKSLEEKGIRGRDISEAMPEVREVIGASGESEGEPSIRTRDENKMKELQEIVGSRGEHVQEKEKGNNKQENKEENRQDAKLQNEAPKEIQDMEKKEQKKESDDSSKDQINEPEQEDKPEQGIRPEWDNKIEKGGQPEDAGKPENAGQPETGGQPEDGGQPAKGGRPDQGNRP